MLYTKSNEAAARDLFVIFQRSTPISYQVRSESIRDKVVKVKQTKYDGTV